VRGDEAVTEHIIIDLPLPHKVLHPNGRTRNYKWRATVVKQHRELAGLVARTQRPKKPFKSARYAVHFDLPRKMDEDNLGGWIKSYLDSLQDAGVIENDSRLTRERLTVTSGEKKTGGKYGVRIEIWQDEPGDNP
jgi:Holliday junction resolvase RusA-like endonuclease